MYKCWDCLGSGKKEYYHQIDNGVCYTCGGTGKTNMIQGEASKAHQENQENIAFHFQLDNRIKKGKKMENDLCLIIVKKIEEKKDIEKDMITLKKYTDLLKALEQTKIKLESLIKW
jgi:hypothetical protein